MRLIDSSNLKWKASLKMNKQGDTDWLLFAAENAPAYMTAIVAMIGIFVAISRLRALHQQRYMTSINEERVRWLNEIRKKFNRYSSLLSQLYIQKNTKRYMEIEDELYELASYIRLLTTPREYPVKILLEFMNPFTPTQTTKS